MPIGYKADVFQCTCSLSAAFPVLLMLLISIEGASCKRATCSTYDPLGCIGRAKLWDRHGTSIPNPSYSTSSLTSRVVDLSGVLSDTHATVFNYMPPILRGNVYERDMFIAYLGQREISINDLFNELVELKRASTVDKDEAEAKWGAGKKLCAFCILWNVVLGKLFEWWRIERAKGHLDGVCSVHLNGSTALMVTYKLLF